MIIGPVLGHKRTCSSFKSQLFSLLMRLLSERGHLPVIQMEVLKLTSRPRGAVSLWSALEVYEVEINSWRDGSAPPGLNPDVVTPSTDVTADPADPHPP